MFLWPIKFVLETSLWISFSKAFSVKVTSAKVLLIIVTFETSLAFKYFSNVDILICFVVLKFSPFPKYEKIINIVEK